MSLNLEKGQRVDITKGTGIKNINVGLGWDVSSNAKSIDIDSMVFALNNTGKCTSQDDFVFYGMPKINGKLAHKSGSIIHSGDNLTGAGEGDDEVISVSLDKVPIEIEKLVIVIAIFKATERSQNFGQVKRAFVRVINADDNKEVLKYDLTEDYSVNTSVIVGEIYKKDGEWKFTALGEGKKAEINELVKLYGL